MEAAFSSAERVTLTGSTTPAFTRSTYSPVAALRPWPALPARTLLTTTLPSRPALVAIWRSGSSSARRTMLMPTCSSEFSPLVFSRPMEACTNVEPPPGTMPSSTAARVADSASSKRCFFSLSSVSVAAPTLILATPPANLAKRSSSFSRS